MSAMMLRVSVWVRRERLRVIVTAVLIGVAAGLAMGLAAGARRTDSAPDRYTRRAGGDPDLVIIQLSGQPLTDQVAMLPGVVSTQAATFVPAFSSPPSTAHRYLNRTHSRATMT